MCSILCHVFSALQLEVARHPTLLSLYGDSGHVFVPPAPAIPACSISSLEDAGWLLVSFFLPGTRPRQLRDEAL